MKSETERYLEAGDKLLEAAAHISDLQQCIDAALKKLEAWPTDPYYHKNCIAILRGDTPTSSE